ncbi:hypothetical protein QN277_004245 [Acacia crassicarpa]|uniref:Uncharacterized protein n=1 Tax=Acacia crassicarpa TaxID=499986 RepID=A0AAE1J002_9FABA|nr:hypothetical protein QN277_004245 [Acacia crassicarpa]
MYTSDWSFDLQNTVDKLEEQKRRIIESETKVEEARRTAITDIPKIQKVQPYLRNRQDFILYYSPKLVSIGPIHGGDKDSQEKLKGGERYKMRWAALYLKDTNQNAQLLFGKIRNELPALMDLYAEEVIEGFRGNNKEEELAWMFLLDGCAVLEFIRNHKEGTYNPEEQLKIKVDQLVLVQQDLLLLENQLPYRLLTLLSNVSENELNQWIISFLKTHPMTTSTIGTGFSNGSEEVKLTVDHHRPPHLLHLLRQIILGNRSKNYGGGSGWGKSERFETYRNIQELKAAGIAVTKWKVKDKRLTDVDFYSGCLSGELRLPTIYMDLTTPSTYLNLMAYEACQDFEYDLEITSYVQFLTSLIKHPDDVKELRSCGCMINFFGSDDEIAHAFSIIAAHSGPNTTIPDPVRRAINRYFRSRYRPWLAQAYHAYFSNSGSFIAFIAASMALALTFIQTWFTVRCSK